MVPTHLARRQTARPTSQVFPIRAQACSPSGAEALLRQLAVVLHATHVVRQAMERERASCQ
jgi:hypothetical protein